jgi:hypothetical protein
MLGGLVASFTAGADARLALEQSRPEILAAATLRSVLLTRRDWRAEREANERRLRERREGDPMTVTFNNSCASSESTFRIVRATADIPEQIIDQRGIGEWCEAPIPFEQQMWLLVLHPDTYEVVAHLAATQTPDGSIIAVLPAYLSREVSPETQAHLELRQLATPVPVWLPESPTAEGMRVYVSERPGFEVRDSRVVIARAIMLDRIFPGLRYDDFL